ncbi:OmpH family outer membrane protein [Psychroflexus sp. ALD_RP9]|uniref:OmpH family outer membrane protein n=1 Tax=Psychroflexus sp. ALD_RP9 TaxID=2777186 RepID=UPI001A9086DB|nr:OmpH family outer membrane protein [Psychroflexus sp. ALD_RP9]QSS96225.1 OmpH family outer membrane protein [Psychroflexus sp. ALD_RP9]
MIFTNRYLYLTIVLVLMGLNLKAQRANKIGYVDMDYILEQVPEYRQSQNRLNQRVQQWKTEIEQKRQQIEDLKDQLKAEKPLLTDELIEEKEDEIKFLEEELLAYKNSKFGVEGDYITQKRQLIQPIQDQVFNAIQDIGLNRSYDFIFENSADALMLFSAKRHDLSDIVLRMIQIEARGNQNTEEVLKDMKPYKSVKKAENDQKEAADRKAKIEERKSERERLMEERQRKFDSIKEAREKKFEERRQKILKRRAEQKRKRDSINKARENNN